MALDLSAGQRAIEGLMLDALVIYRNVGGVNADTLDGDNVLHHVGPSPVVVYSSASTGLNGRSLAHVSGLGGMGKVRAVNAQELRGDVSVIDSTFMLSIPLDAPEVRTFDWAVLTVSGRDPLLQGKIFDLRTVRRSTLAVSRRLGAEMREPSGR